MHEGVIGLREGVIGLREGDAEGMAGNLDGTGIGQRRDMGGGGRRDGR